MSCNILCLETSGKNCSVAIFSQERQIALIEEVSESFSHSENLHIFIERALKESGLSPKAISAIAISGGPGSYTGLRIGTATAKGLCYGWDIPLIAIPTLLILAHKKDPYLTDIKYIAPMIDARRMEVYTAIYSTDFSSIEEERAEILSENSYLSYLEKGKVLFLGDGSGKWKDICQHPNAYFSENQYPSAQQMGILAFKKYQKQVFEDIAYYEPFYLKEFHTTKKV